ncbi:MAG: ATP-binding cassette domain-containing protein, partial [Bacilli bacterium]|nr:ATP-binding cassette domain-containing protein [Bacilli bacterium]
MRLEVKNLIKTYSVKNQPPVKALDGVSLLFPETGLVFILGKSGSGKSTLLNVMGGLDSFDSGEIIINNRSSHDFSGSEMDSYRNTYLGFIFQEYNILNDFNIHDNIALALELQNRKADEETI